MINEVLYDPEGKDAGFEFVEIFNVGSAAISLKGWRLETGNGSYEDRWTLEWTGGDEDTVGPHSFFVIGEESVDPPPQAVADLDLQNGPDACRLLAPAGIEGIPAGIADLVGWGEHIYAEYYEGEPADAVASGASLGRDPDGNDADNNASDLREFDEPSPGGFNHPQCDLGLARAGISRHTGVLGLEVDLVCVVSNAGTSACGLGSGIAVEIGALADSASLSADVPAGQESKFVVRTASPGEGLHRAAFRLNCTSDTRPGNDTLAITFVIPPSPIVINEVMFRPASGDCEWLEVLNRSDRVFSLRGWTIEDSGGRPRAISAKPLAIEPSRMLVLVEDSEAFGRAYGDSNGIEFLRPDGGWPTLNDVDGALGFADALVLRDPSGTAVDSVVYRAGWSLPGVSVERIDPAGPSTGPANWSPHYGPGGGSPGLANSVSFFLPRGGRALDISPARFSPDGDGRDDLAAISVRVGSASAVSLAVYDLNGFLVRRLVDGERIEAGRVTFWDGRDGRGDMAPTGIYIVALQAGAAGSVQRARAAVVLLRR